MVEQYLVAQVPKEQLFLSLTCNDIKIIMLNYDTGEANVFINYYFFSFKIIILFYKIYFSPLKI